MIATFGIIGIVLSRRMEKKVGEVASWSMVPDKTILHDATSFVQVSYRRSPKILGSILPVVATGRTGANGGGKPNRQVAGTARVGAGRERGMELPGRQGRREGREGAPIERRFSWDEL
jgi:hypothetical protein